jgi:hypothetical protein
MHELVVNWCRTKLSWSKRMHVLPKFVYCVLSDSLLYVCLKGHALTCLPHPYEYWVNWLKCWHISGVPEVRAVNATARPVSKTSLCGYFYSGNSFQIVWTTWLAQFSDLIRTRQLSVTPGRYFMAINTNWTDLVKIKSKQHWSWKYCQNNRINVSAKK